MTSSMLSLALVALLPAQAPARTETPRKPNPFAPSLPLLTNEEEEQLDQIIDRFILYDTGRLKGEEGKKALAEFQRLGADAIFALIRGMNRAAAIDDSCPAVVIAKKINSLLRATTDSQLLEFARENIGAGVSRSRHMGVLKDLKAVCLFRQREVAQKTAVLSTTAKTPRTMSIGELVAAADKERGATLKPYLTELEKRSGDQVLNALAGAAISYETEIKQLGRELLGSYLARQTPAFLQQKLKDDRLPVRESAARVVGSKGLRLGGDLIELLNDSSADVRQAAREALVRLSKGTDHGPEPDASDNARAEAIRKWRAWWSAQGGR